MHIDDLLEVEDELAPPEEPEEPEENWPKPKFFTRAYFVWLAVIVGATLLHTLIAAVRSGYGVWDTLGILLVKLAIVLALFHIIYAALMVRAGFTFGVTPLKPVNRNANTRAVYRDHVAKLSRTQRELIDLYGQDNREE